MGWLVFVAALGVYAWTAAPALAWLDAAELSTAAQALAIAHPPGHPIPSLLGRLLLYLPLGEAAFRVNLASALAGALAAAGAYHAARATCARFVAPRAAAGVAAAAALGFAFTRAAWEQAARAEVYALQAALLAAALAWAVAWALERDARALYAATFATGLGLANHHYVAVCFFVPAGAVILALRPGAAAAGRLAAVGLLGLAAYLYLPLRAARDLLGWGDPDSAGRFLWTLSAQAFQKTLGGNGPSFLERLGDVVTAVVDNVSLPAAGLALLGLWALLRRAPAVAVLLAGVAVGGLVGRALLDFEPANPDALGYLLPATATLFVLAAAGLAALGSVGPRVAAALAVLAAVLPAAQLARFADEASFRGGEAADAYARAAVAVPGGALAVTSYFQTHFLAVAAQRLEGERPDVTVLDRNLLTHPYAPAAARRRDPELAAVIDAPLVGGRPTPTAALLALGRPVLVELAMNLEPAPPLAAARAAAEARDRGAWEVLGRSLTTGSLPDRHGAEGLLAWQAFLRARFYCGLGRTQAARQAATVLRADDPMLAPLASCLSPRGPTPTRP